VDVDWSILGAPCAVSTCCIGRQATHRPACETGFHSDIERDGTTNVVERRHTVTGDTTRFLVHRRCLPGCPPSTSAAWLMLEPTM
jgi:hypothetical protein